MRTSICGLISIVLLVCGYSSTAGELVITRDKRVDDQKEVLNVLSSLQHPKTGTIVEDPGDKGKKVLRIRGKDVRTAIDFEPTYSESTNGLIAFILYSSNAPPTHLAEVGADGRVNTRLGELWISRGNVPPERVSPCSMHARNPCISPDGRYIAYTGCRADANGFLGKESVFLTDLSNPQSAPHVLATTQDNDGTACPLAWSRSATLSIFVSDGPDGAKSRIETLRVTYGSGQVGSDREK